jgi:TfoX N-terminal domain
MAYDVHLADRIRAIINTAGEFSEKKMFGGLAFMVNGRMCCGVLKTDLVLRPHAGTSRCFPVPTSYQTDGLHRQADEINDLRERDRHGLR